MSPSAIALRPELAFGPNPFIEAAAPFVPFSDWGKRLRRYPLDDVSWQSIPPQQREPLLGQIKRHFAPHRGLLAPAADLQKLFRAGLDRRNVHVPGEVSRTLKVSLTDSRTQLHQLGCLGGGGGIWAGMTATGRTTLFKRVMEIIAPSQVIEFPKSEACGWERLTQVCYLHVDFPSNGSRGGLLKRILLALDQAVGTSLSDKFRPVTNIDVLLVEVCRQLSNVRCSILAIDEKQGSTFDDSAWHVEFLLFYLSLMNLGISVLLLGNPLAFRHIRMFSQVMRRFSEAGHHEFLPAESASDLWWKQDYVPRIRKFNLVEKWDVPDESRRQLEFENAGGLQGLAPALQVEVQLSALRRSNQSAAAVTREDYARAAASPRFIEQRRIALSVRGLGASSDPQYLDVPDTSSTSSNTDSSSGKQDGLKIPAEPTVHLVKSLLSQYAREQSRKTNKLVTKLKSLRDLGPEDIRMLGMTNDHLDNMERTLEAARAKKSGRKEKLDSKARADR